MVEQKTRRLKVPECEIPFPCSNRKSIIEKTIKTSNIVWYLLTNTIPVENKTVSWSMLKTGLTYF